MKKLVVIGLALLVLIFSYSAVNWYNYHQKFDKTSWNEGDEGFGYSKRKYMLNSLLKNHRLKGRTYSQLCVLLGAPRIDSGSNKGYYNIELDYGLDIDPVYTKDLVVTFNKHLIVTDVNISEWKH